VAAGELVFGLKLLDGMSGPSKQASAALKGLEQKLKTAKSALSGYQQQLTKAKALGDIEGYRKYSALVDGSRRSVFELQQSLEGLGGSSGAANGGLAALGGPITMIAGAAVAAVGALAGLTYKVLEYASAATEAKRSTLALFDALGEGRSSGQQVLDLFDEMGPKMGRTREELKPWAKQLEAIGITDLSELRGQLTAVSSAAAIGGEEGASAYENLTRKIHTFIETGQGLKIPIKGLGSLREVGLDVNDVAREMGITAKQLGQELKAGTADAAKFGDALESAITKKGKGALAGLAQSLPSVLKIGEESFRNLFDSIDFKPLAGELQQFFDLFSQSEPSGQALKKSITESLNDMIKWIGEGVRSFKHFFEDVEIGLLKADLFMKPYVALWHKLSDAINEANRPLKTFIDYSEKAIGFLPKLALGAGAKATGIDQGAGPLSAPLSPEAWAQAHGAAGPPSLGQGAGVGPTGLITAPAHAEGGLVAKPAPGEAFASVAPGETIVPRNAQPPANDNSGGGIHIERLELHIDAPQGVTNATEVTAHALATALERYQLAVGR
jgi:hypothetical protein